ncbi:MAG: hypothetical protein CMH78_07250 [Nitrospinae bacterium]|nr:hypothetical protein [Nitrospinota bacterium]
MLPTGARTNKEPNICVHLKVNGEYRTGHTLSGNSAGLLSGIDLRNIVVVQAAVGRLREHSTRAI